MMNWARIQMKTWIAKKNEHKANVQRRCDNRGKTHKAFQRWGEKTCDANMMHRRGGKKMGRREERERGRMELNIGCRVRNTNPRNGCLINKIPEAYTLARGAITIPYIPYHTIRIRPGRSVSHRRIDAVHAIRYKYAL
eukprot:6183334-Pleurochrysis_carterae.AAC.1